MTNEMRQVVEEFETLRFNNPADGVDVSTRFQQYLVFSGEAHRFDNKDLAQGATAVGIPKQEIGAFMDSLASWL